MNRLSFFIVAVLAFEISSAFAQTNYQGSTKERPCIADVGSGRPTLKRRQPAPDNPPTDGGGVNQKQQCTKEAAGDNQKPTHIEFEGLHAFSETEIVDAFRERGIGLAKTPMSSSEVLAKAVDLIKELLAARGHFHATVDARIDEETGTATFLVDEGQRLSLAEVRFEGSRNFSSQELASKMGEYLAHFPKMQAGYDSDIFDYCSRRLVGFIRNEGYLKATFSEPAKMIDARGLVLIIQVDEGVLYRLGEIKIEGAKAVAPEKVRAMLSLRQGDIASGEDISKWLFEDLKRVYSEIGHIEFAAEPGPEFKAANVANEGVVDFKVTIEEGRRFRVRTIKFRGSDLPDEELLGLLRIQKGDVFSQRLFEESVSELNRLGRFQPIDKDRDTDFRTDDEEAVIDILIKVKNKDGEIVPKDSSLTRRQP